MIATLEAKNAKMSATLQAHDQLIQSLRLRIARLKKHGFGKSSEKIEREIQQLELALEDLMIAASESSIIGVDIPDSTPVDWCGRAIQVLLPLIELIEAAIKSSDLLHVDDTPIQVLDRSLRDKGLGKGVKKGRLWTYARDQRPIWRALSDKALAGGPHSACSWRMVVSQSITTQPSGRCVLSALEDETGSSRVPTLE